MSNKITIYGRITKDPEITTLKSGKKLCTFNVASRGRNKNDDGSYKADFFTCITFEKRAEMICEFCKKGDPIFVIGTMESSAFEKEDGTKTTFWKCVVDDIEFCATKADREQNQKETPVTKGEQVDMTEMEDDDGLPF